MNRDSGPPASSASPLWNITAASRKTALLAMLLLAFLLSGCVTLKDPEASQEYSADVVVRIDPATPAGQTFISRRPRLNGIQLWLRQVQPPSNNSAAITVRLYHKQSEAWQPGEARPLAEVVLTSAQVLGGLPVNIPLPPQQDPAGQSYYVELATTEGAYDLYGRAEDAYPYGELYVRGEAQSADAAFRTSYDYDTGALAGDLGAALRYAWLVGPLLLALWLPGRLLVTRLEPYFTMDWGERTALSIGLSLSAIPVVLLWTTEITRLTGLHWTRAAVWLVYLLLAGLLIWGAVRLWRRQRWVHGRRLEFDWLDAGLLVVFLFSLALRLIMARDLAGPAWVDSVHHALLTRLIMDQGAFPHTYSPFVQATSANYHPGFHSGVAVFTWLSGMALPQALLFYGQVINALSVFAIYLFTTTLTRDRAAGLAAALLVGVFSPMPAYYTSWGRYTQLAGLVVLPAAIRLIQELVQSRRWSWVLLFEAALACAGVFLIHYRVVIFLAILLIAYGIAETIRVLDKQLVWRSTGRLIGRVCLAGGLAILMALPWFLVIVRSLLAPYMAAAQPGPQTLTGLPWGYLSPASGRIVLLLGIAGLVWSILRARWFGPMLALWTGLMYMSANQGAIRVPFAGAVNLNSVEISLFVPLTILGGFFVADVARLIGQSLPPPLRPVYLAGLAAGAAWLTLIAAQVLLPILNPTTFLIRAADIQAMGWVQEHIPAGEIVLINPFLWGYGYYAGQDGGFYLSSYAARPTIPPPLLFGLDQPVYVQHIDEISKGTLDKGKDPAALHELMQSQGIQYVYLGARGGTISPQALEQSPLFEQLYAQAGVSIFKIR